MGTNDDSYTLLATEMALAIRSFASKSSLGPFTVCLVQWN